ncbi:formimidoylglutamase [Lacinutrix sp. 5H-3-7-4]|uniref:formimidoylglutamase n=1 Tax=Lacinutrix sp. (strain 5H-3-7-4) TaxID=983544 RepID=UPI0002ED2BA2|nr:formimidoylglutamase [Lacinutrix sp. 5H-3-7-4]
MSKLVLFNSNQLNNIIKKREGEIKFGERIKLLTAFDDIYGKLKNLDVKYVLIGLPEDVGVFANLGNTGTNKAWESTIKILLNTQHNQENNGNNVLILGYLDFSEELKTCSKLSQDSNKDLKKSRQIVENIDKEVTNIIFNIVKAGKTPIIIGGGHNNAYGNIKGTSLALNKKINVVNFDAHTDFRALEGRHSGNGFSYAFAEGFLNRYFIFGLHKNYTSQAIFDTALNAKKRIRYNTFEELEVEKILKYKPQMKKALKFISKTNFGIEIDCDAIINIPSSAKTPSGFSVSKTRQFVSYFASNKNAKYLHVCEAAPTPKTATQVGKLITYLITDFIRANES